MAGWFSLGEVGRPSESSSQRPQFRVSITGDQAGTGVLTAGAEGSEASPTSLVCGWYG